MPLLTALAKSLERRQLLKPIASTVAIGRPHLTTPEVPADRLAALRAAFDAAMKDPQFLADSKWLEFGLKPMDHAALTAHVDDAVNTRKEIVDKTKAAVGGTGGE